MTAPAAVIYVQQEVDSLINAVEIDTRNREIAAAVRADRDQHRIEALPPQIGNGEVPSRGLIQLQRDVARLENLTDLRLHDVARQPVLRNPEVQHSSRHGRSFEIVTAYPISARSCAADSPTGPPPMIATL